MTEQRLKVEAEILKRIDEIRPSNPKKSDYTHGIDVGLAMAKVAIKDAPTIEQEELMPDGTLHLFTDTDLSKVDRVWVSQNGTHFGDLYYADGEPKIGKWVGIKEYCDHLNEEAEREGKGKRYMPSGMNIHVYCNQCWEPNDRRTTYCPNCSARMVQEGEDND